MTITATGAEEALAVAAEAELLYSEAEVASAVEWLAECITRETVGEDLLVVCIMNGGLTTTGLLLPRLSNPLRLDYVHATRYRDATQGGQLQWYREPQTSLAKQTVVVVDDIFDEGHTLQAICEYCANEGAARVYSAVLVNKQHDNKPTDFAPDFVGLQVPNRYVFGSGMDYKGYLRNLPGIYALTG